MRRDLRPIRPGGEAAIELKLLTDARGAYRVATPEAGRSTAGPRTRPARRRPVLQAPQPPPRAGPRGKRKQWPYQAEHYKRWQGLLRSVLQQIPGLTDGDFTAHVLLAAVRADLIEHVAGHEHVPREKKREQLADFTTRVLRPGPARSERED